MQSKLIKTQKAVLFIAGGLLTLVAGFILGAPSAFYGSNGIEIGPNTSLLNELKAPAGLLLVAGLFMLAAVFQQRLADNATALAALIYLAYASSRFASMAFDGVPAAGLVQAAALEALIGLACLAVISIRQLPMRRAV